jgi:oligoendopeptidase F
VPSCDPRFVGRARDGHSSYKKGVSATWDLSTLYAGPDDPRIAADEAAARRGADAFAARHRAHVAELDAVHLAEAITTYESLCQQARRPGFYAYLLFAADTQDERARRLVDRTREAALGVANVFTFFELELKAIPDDAFARLVDHPVLADRRHWLGLVRLRRPYTLSEPEERVVNQKNLTGRGALVQLFDELSGSLRFRVDDRELTGEQVLSLLYEPDRALRERAYTAFLDTYATHGVVWTSVLNGLMQDHRLECELRRVPDPVLPTHLDNEVRPETVHAMMDATERHYELARRYFRSKAKLLRLPRLKNTDLYAPLGEAPRRVAFDEARTLVLDAFASFSPEFAALARDFFERRWIDAAVRPGKRLGAFCASHGPDTNPWVLLSYTDRLRDVATLAHELGHGVHDRLASRHHALDFLPPLTLAETASVFGELTLTRALLDREPRREVRRALLCAKIEDTIATVFRQNVLTRFEIAAHARRTHGPLTADELGELWWTENAKLYGDAVEMIPAYRWGWSYIPHFVHSRFYCYAYVFGELLVLALYQRHREEGTAFVPRYLELLASGGSEAPDVVLGRLGFRIDEPSFWDRGFAVVRDLLGELETTLD